MYFSVTINISNNRYVVTSKDLNYTKSYHPICMTTNINNNEVFLSIGEPVEDYSNDRDFIKMKGNKEIKVFNPFSSSKFEPYNAALVIRFFVQNLITTNRSRVPEFFHDFFFTFWDKCSLVITVQNYGNFSIELRKEFEKEIKEIPCIKALKTQ